MQKYLAASADDDVGHIVIVKCASWQKPRTPPRRGTRNTETRNRAIIFELSNRVPKRKEIFRESSRSRSRVPTGRTINFNVVDFLVFTRVSNARNPSVILFNFAAPVPRVHRRFR